MGLLSPILFLSDIVWNQTEKYYDNKERKAILKKHKAEQEAMRIAELKAQGKFKPLIHTIHTHKKLIIFCICWTILYIAGCIKMIFFD